MFKSGRRLRPGVENKLLPDSALVMAEHASITFGTHEDSERVTVLAAFGLVWVGIGKRLSDSSRVFRCVNSERSSLGGP